MTDKGNTVQQSILVVDFTEGGVGAEAIVQVTRYEFPVVTVDHIVEFARVHAALRCTTYDLVILTTDHRLRDVEIIAEGIRTFQFAKFDGGKLRGTGGKTPIIISVPQRHILAFASTPNVRCIGAEEDVGVLIAAVTKLGFPPRTKKDSFETQTAVSRSPGEAHHRPKITKTA